MMIIDERINKVMCMDARDFLKDLPDKSVNLLLTDPPYGVGIEYDIYKDTEENWYKLMEWFIPEAKRVSKMTILPSCRIMMLPYIYQKFPPDWLIAWYKGSPGHRAFVGFNDWEPLLVYGKNEGVQMHDYFYCQPETGDQHGHPCPKSVKWAEWLIKRATKRGELVCDPFSGVGTTGVAAKKLGRQFIGCDISPAYCASANQRIDAVQDSKIETFFNDTEEKK